MIRTTTAQTNDQMSPDVRGGMAHVARQTHKPFELLDPIRDDKSNRGNKESKETAEYWRWRRLEGPVVLDPKMESHTLTLTAGLLCQTKLCVCPHQQNKLRIISACKRL